MSQGRPTVLAGGESIHLHPPRVCLPKREVDVVETYPLPLSRSLTNQSANPRAMKKASMGEMVTGSPSIPVDRERFQHVSSQTHTSANISPCGSRPTEISLERSTR
eukprot:6063416-Pyramimonas_sp.AAC.2